ncbi:MAG: hypothetical protein EOM67_04950 [Spirochaetia bacterium]|nr:hypothetical protein [Spirochaetia bacterium]
MEKEILLLYTEFEMNEKSFRLYLLQVRGLKESSVKHYFDAIRKIETFFPSFDMYNITSLYEIDSFYDLELLKTRLKNNPDFVALDERGNRMYSAGLNRFIEFATSIGFSSYENVLSLIDTPREIPRSMIASSSMLPRRDRIIINQVISNSHYRCEIEHTHSTFISKATHNQYMEGHHIIPLKVQDAVSTSLDVYANIISLCPVCHRFLHYGLKEEKKGVLENIYRQRGERLHNSGIMLEKGEFFDLIEYGEERRALVK